MMDDTITNGTIEELRILVRKLASPTLPEDVRQNTAICALSNLNDLDSRVRWLQGQVGVESEWRFEDAKAYLERCKADFSADYSETHDAEHAITSAIGLPSNEEVLKLIWAAGQVTEAFEAVHEDVDQAILDALPD